MNHPIITHFEDAADLLDIAADPASLDEAIVRLAAWMDIARDHLTEDDVASAPHGCSGACTWFRR